MEIQLGLMKYDTNALIFACILIFHGGYVTGEYLNACLIKIQKLMIVHLTVKKLLDGLY